MNKFVESIIEASDKAHKELERGIGRGKLLFSPGYFSRKAIRISQDQLSKLRYVVMMVGFLLVGLGMPAYLLGKLYPVATEYAFVIGVVGSLVCFQLYKRWLLRSNEVICLDTYAVAIYVKCLAKQLSISYIGSLAIMAFSICVMVSFGTLYFYSNGFLLFACFLAALFLLSSYALVAFIATLALRVKYEYWGA
ncbi:hypothetical protein [Ketobacter alkanivorans]|uniref:Uncharacterized protein n=1 Tax=Ketobacter alkanivorans TaxID=1917421 RepID=A0A2K9LR24_9GAMM|nr:hypothetical protein [Ketobacter alkanivorans]AUM14717.1 hypothetical protein Kalk_20795 [Ketobacter alkanivorans]